MGGFLGQVDNVVEARREQEDVLLVQRRGEDVIDKVVDLVGGVIALVFEVAQPGVPAPAFQQRLAEFGQRLAHDLALPAE